MTIMESPWLVALGVVVFLGIVVILPVVIENNIFAGIMTFLIGPFLRRRSGRKNGHPRSKGSKN